MRKRREKVIKHWKLNKDKNRPITHLARECNVTPETYRKYLREVGYDPKGVVYKYKANRSFFNEIDSEKKAYWLGFITADGNITIKRGSYYILSISVAKKDKEILVKFLEDLEADFPIYSKYSPDPNGSGKIFEQFRVDISSKEICEGLIKHGCMPNKSLKVRIPNLEDPYLKHFLRGYFDGNGSIIFNERRYLTVQVASSVSFLNDLIMLLESKLSITPKKIYRPKKAKNDKWGIWKCVTDEAERLLNYLYSDSTLYLERKYLKYREFVYYKSGKIGEG